MYILTYAKLTRNDLGLLDILPIRRVKREKLRSCGCVIRFK